MDPIGRLLWYFPSRDKLHDRALGREKGLPDPRPLSAPCAEQRYDAGERINDRLHLNTINT